MTRGEIVLVALTALVPWNLGTPRIWLAWLGRRAGR
jgi:hypothetical protein